jgi:hypothetical protein
LRKTLIAASVTGEAVRYEYSAEPVLMAFVIDMIAEGEQLRIYTGLGCSEERVQDHARKPVRHGG